MTAEAVSAIDSSYGPLESPTMDISRFQHEASLSPREAYQ